VERWHEVARETEALRLPPDLLGGLAKQIAWRGYAGDARPVLLAHLVVTSRLLQPPMNLRYFRGLICGEGPPADAAIAFYPTKGRQTEVNDAGMFARLRDGNRWMVGSGAIGR
jgi:hypothetical protein